SELRSRPVKVQGPLMYFCAGFGGLCTVLPLVWPRYAFWMVWGAALGVPEVINYRSGAPSLLRDLETGRPGRLLRLLLGGLWAGIAWESLNYWARCKWIYTVPGMEDWKLFEMPFLGFLGFPALSLAAFAFYALVCHALRGGRHWEAMDSQPARAMPRLRFAFAASAAIMFSATTFVALTNVNVESRRPLLAELEGMDGGAVAQLRTVGIRTPEQLHRAVETDGVAAFCRRTRLAAEQIDRAYLHAALALHKGMGPRNAKLLLAAGVTRVVDLVLANPQDLYGRLLAVAAQYGFPPPRLAEVKVWIRAARVAGSIRR
ncbi:MAG: DUF4332 domain-containing protein, partial [Planctomycetes bacterium]|nr:DUF4332 domain-containing protein [Planctomycetota bacterium]